MHHDIILQSVLSLRIHCPATLTQHMHHKRACCLLICMRMLCSGQQHWRSADWARSSSDALQAGAPLSGACLCGRQPLTGSMP